jgi:hypothetical protein
LRITAYFVTIFTAEESTGKIFKMHIKILYSTLKDLKRHSAAVSRRRYMMGDREKKMIRPSACIILLLLTLLCTAGSSQGIGRYLHKKALLGAAPTDDMVKSYDRRPISSAEAAMFAVKHLETEGVKNIVICEVTWIAAPLGGWLVKTKGKWTHKGKTYKVFQIGIRDGTDECEGKYKAGEIFVFIALGKGKSGEFWYPPPGPDIWPPRSAADSSMLDYEFLIDRKRLEGLDTLYK